MKKLQILVFIKCLESVPNFMEIGFLIQVVLLLTTHSFISQSYSRLA